MLPIPVFAEDPVDIFPLPAGALRPLLPDEELLLLEPLDLDELDLPVDFLSVIILQILFL